MLVIISSISGKSLGATPELTRYTFSEYHMGIDARLTVYATSEIAAKSACSAAFNRIAELDTAMSDYRVDSELNRLCASPAGVEVKLSADLFKVFAYAQKVSEQTGGAFDITASPVIRLWRAARKSGVLPSPSEIEAARKLVGYKNLVLNSRRRTAKLLIPGMKLDLGGIAKGYANDEAQKVLKKFGITRAMVEMGGDIVVSGPPPGAKGWVIRVPNAVAQKPGARALGPHLTGTLGAGPGQPTGAIAPPPHPSSLCSQTLSPSGESSTRDQGLERRACSAFDRYLGAGPGDLALGRPGPEVPVECRPVGLRSQGESLLFAHCAISTSGDTEQFTIIGGVQYSHVVDPRTGWALTNRVQFTVISRFGLTADPLSTALTIISEAERTALLKNYKGTKTFIKRLKSDGSDQSD